MSEQALPTKCALCGGIQFKIIEEKTQCFCGAFRPTLFERLLDDFESAANGSPFKTPYPMGLYDGLCQVVRAPKYTFDHLVRFLKLYAKERNNG